MDRKMQVGEIGNREPRHGPHDQRTFLPEIDPAAVFGQCFAEADENKWRAVADRAEPIASGMPHKPIPVAGSDIDVPSAALSPVTRFCDATARAMESRPGEPGVAQVFEAAGPGIQAKDDQEQNSFEHFYAALLRPNWA